jgi:hypothetical protein
MSDTLKNLLIRLLSKFNFPNFLNFLMNGSYQQISYERIIYKRIYFFI